MKTLLHFKWDFLILAAALVVAFFYEGWEAVWLAAILIVVEIVFSFDNAAVNAKYLAKMNPFWQRMFLSVGVIIAVFGMRLIFPFVIVCLTGSMSPVTAVHLALAQGPVTEPGTYGYILNQAHPTIAAFGGIFLLMLFLDFLFEDREITWLSWIEKPLMRLGKLDMLTPMIAGIVLLVSSEVLVHTVNERSDVLFAGVLGMVVYMAVNGFASMMESRAEAKAEALDEQTSGGKSQLLLAGKAAFSMFLFLEVLDATFSFDGVIGAFAITPDPLIIALGLGVGALFVRSMTVYLVRTGTLAEYRYLEHGAHWAIGALATLLLLTIQFELPDWMIGLVGLAFIFSALGSSVRRNRQERAEDAAEEGEHPPVREPSRVP